MAYDASPSSTHNPATGGTPTAAWGDIINGNFETLGGAWTSFTPTWTGSGSNPAIGNGTISGAYIQIGKTLKFRVYILMGGTTTYGTGTWQITLPNSLTSVATPQVAGEVYGSDTGTADRVGVARCDASSSFVYFVSHNGTVNWSASVPHTWASTDFLVAKCELEVA